MQTTMSTAAPRARSGALSYLSLFTSLSTLLCCALPSLFVLFGLGATVGRAAARLEQPGARVSYRRSIRPCRD